MPGYIYTCYIIHILLCYIIHGVMIQLKIEEASQQVWDFFGLFELWLDIVRVSCVKQESGAVKVWTIKKNLEGAYGKVDECWKWIEWYNWCK